MQLPQKEADFFISLYSSLIGFAASRLGGIAGIKDSKSFKNVSNKARFEARDKLLEDISLIDLFIEANPDGFREKELGLTLQLKRFVRGNFFIVRDLKKYTIFLNTETPAKAYGVLGLSEEIVDILPYRLPMYIEAVLLPWKGQIICDGFMQIYNIHFGTGIRREMNELYNQAKARGVITSLDPGWKPDLERKKPAAPKTPAISRLLKKCPKMVKEFKEYYGEPRKILSGEKIKEIGIWNMEGKPAFEYDSILEYPNIIEDKLLQLYTKGEEIKYISVVERAIWQKSDLRPCKGRSLLR